MADDPLDLPVEELDALIQRATGSEKINLLSLALDIERDSGRHMERIMSAQNAELRHMWSLLKAHREFMRNHGIEPFDMELPVFH